MSFYSVSLQISGNILRLNTVSSDLQKVGIRQASFISNGIVFKILFTTRQFRISMPVYYFRILTNSQHNFFNNRLTAQVVTFTEILITFSTIFRRKDQKIIPYFGEVLNFLYTESSKLIRIQFFTQSTLQ